MLIDDEDDLRAGLRALTAPVPPQPAERVERSVGRARAIRRRRAAVTSVAVLLPLVAVGVVVTRPAPPPDYTNVATWPDRSDPSLATLERNVLTEWGYSHEVPPGEKVRWLYSGEVPGTDSVVVAFATCGAGHCSRTVLAYGDGAEMAEPPEDDSSTPWLTQEREIAPGAGVGVLSEYLDSAVSPPDGRTTVLFVLAPPDAARVSYVAPPRVSGGGSSGDLSKAGESYVADIGYVDYPVRLSVQNRDGASLYAGPVGDGTSVGNARLIKTLDLPSGYVGGTMSWGQLTDEVHNIDGSSGDDRYALFARCVGGVPPGVDRLHVVMNGYESDVPCDGRAHRATPLLDAVPVDFEEEGLGSSPQPAFEFSLSSDDPYTVYVVQLAKRG